MSVNLREIFFLFDRDADGRVIGADIPTMIRAAGANPFGGVLEKLVSGKEADYFEYEEFEKLAAPLVQGINVRDNLMSAFRPFDRDNSGQLSTSELKHVMKNLQDKLSEPEIDRLIHDADPGNSGKISYEALVNLLLG